MAVQVLGTYMVSSKGVRIFRVKMFFIFLGLKEASFLWLSCATSCTFLFSDKDLFVLRFYGQVNPLRSCRAQSVYLITLLLCRFSPLSSLPVLVHILSLKTDNCFLESIRERMTIENIS